MDINLELGMLLFFIICLIAVFLGGNLSGEG
jgi:hypothetical protein